jgi:hypothetical protein
MAARTKVVVLVGAGLILLCIPGIVFNTRKGFEILAALFIFVPLVVNIVGMVVLLIIIACFKRRSSKDLSDNNKGRTDYATKYMSIAIAFWVGSLIVVVLYGRAGDAQLQNDNLTAATVGIVASVLDHICQFTILFCILSLVDRRGGVLRIIDWLRHGTEFGSQTTGTTGSRSLTRTSKNSIVPPTTVMTIQSHSGSQSKASVDDSDSHHSKGKNKSRSSRSKKSSVSEATPNGEEGSVRPDDSA